LGSKQLNVSIPEEQFNWIQTRNFKPSWLLQQTIQQLMDKENNEDIVKRYARKITWEILALHGSGTKYRPELQLNFIIDNRTEERFFVKEPLVKIGCGGYTAGTFYYDTPFFEKTLLNVDTKNHILIWIKIDYYAVKQLISAIEQLTHDDLQCSFSVDGKFKIEHELDKSKEFEIIFQTQTLVKKKDILEWLKMWEIERPRTPNLSI